MSQGLPENVDAWRMVQARRSFEGRLPLAALPRLAADLAAADGDAAYNLEFGTDEFGVAFLHVRADAVLPLVCQRTLERFDFPVRVDTRLGMIAHEADEAGLPAGYEPLLLTGDGALRLADVVEDELLLAVPAVPVKPGTEYVERSWGDDADASGPEPENPFAALKKIK
jgi:uncharacterized protein